jgi:hypothetical protein
VKLTITLPNAKQEKAAKKQVNKKKKQAKQNNYSHYSDR